MNDDSPFAVFSSDWQHNSADNRPASYTARKTFIYSCGKCGRGLQGGPGDPWPRYCSLGDRNDRPED